MATATEVATPGGFIGPARTFRVSPSLSDPSNGGIAYDHVTVVLVLNYGPRVEIFGARPDGSARSMNALPGSFILQHEVTLDDACLWALTTAGGYVLTEPDYPVVEFDPLPE
jgi:hypothetical protein